MTYYFNNYLNGISDKILSIDEPRNEYRIFQRLIIYRQVLLSSENILYENLAAQEDLLKFGFIIQRRGGLEVASRIHQSCFDEEWVLKNLAQNSIYKRILYWAEEDNDLRDQLCNIALDCQQNIQHGEKEWVDELVKNQIVDGWEDRNEVYHQSWIDIRNRIINNEPEHCRSVLKLYKRILQGWEVRFKNGNREHRTLLESRLVKAEHNKLQIAKPIYKLVFNRNWTDQEIERILSHRTLTVIRLPPEADNTSPIVILMRKIWHFFTGILILITYVTRNYLIRLTVGISIFSILVLLLYYNTSVINLQTHAYHIVEDFIKYKVAQLDSLSLAIKDGKQLENILNISKKSNLALSEYPAISPIYALQYIIDNIYEKNRFQEHGSPVRSVNFSSDNQKELLLASTGYDKSVWLWNLSDVSKSRTVVSKLSDQGNLNIVNFVPKQNILVTVGDKNGKIKFWDFDGKNIVSNIKKIYEKGNKTIYQQEAITNLKFSPDGQLLATIGSRTKELRLWQISFNKNSKEISLYQLQIQQNSHDNKNLILENIDNVAFPPNYNSNEPLIAVVENQRTVKLWKITFPSQDTAKIDELQAWNSGQAGINNLYFNHDGNLIVTAAKDGTIKLWNLQENSKQQSLKETIKINETKELKISISPDGEFLAATGENGEIQLWRLIPKVEQIDLKDVKLNDNQGRVYSISFNPNRNSGDKMYLATGGDDKTVRIWEISKLYLNSDNEPFTQYLEKNKDIGIGKVSDSDETQRVVLLKEDGTIQVNNFKRQDINDVKPLTDRLGNTIKAKIITISPDKKKFAFVDMNGSVQQWDLSKEPQIGIDKVDENDNSINNLILSNDSKFVIIKEQGQASLLDFGGNLNKSINHLQEEVTSASFGSDGKTTIIATGNSKGEIHLWDSKGEIQIKNKFIKLNDGKVKSIKFSPNAHYMVTIGSSNNMILWKLDNNFLDFVSKGKNLPLPEKFLDKEKITIAAFSPEQGKFANLIATADDSNSVEIWNFKGEQLAKFRGDWNKTVNITFSIDGKDILAVGDNGVAKKWELKDLNSLLDEGCLWFKDYEDYQFKVSRKKIDRLCLG